VKHTTVNVDVAERCLDNSR